MGPRALFTLLLVASAGSFGCVQRALLLPVAIRTLTASSAPSALVQGAPKADAAEPPGRPGRHRFIVRAGDSKLEVTGGDVQSGHHVMRFARWQGALFTDDGTPPERPSGKLVLDVDTTTLETDPEVEGFLRSDLLEVNRYPRARILADIRPRTDDVDGHVVQGRVLLHGVERVIRFHASLRRDGDGYRLEALFDVSRQAFDIRRADVWDVFIYDDFRVVLDLAAHAEHVSAEVLPPAAPSP